MAKFRPDRMKTRRLELGLSQSQLAKLVGVSQQAIGQWENKEAERPKKLNELATALKCDVDWLLGGQNKPNPPSGVGIISWVQAGALAETIDNYQPGDADYRIDYDGSCKGNLIGLEVKGTSMNMISPDGSIIIIDLSQREMLPNQLYVVKIGDDATYKQFKQNPDRLQPLSFDPAHREPIYIRDKPICPVGRVIRTMMDFE